jgi:sensor histidine kinase regulating citrate/malate metabolism
MRTERVTKMKRGLSLRAKISVMIILLLTFALLLNVFLNYFNFEKNYTSMVHSRFLVIARDLQNTAEYGLGLGLSLPELKNLQEVINGILDEQKDIVSIAIFDDQGQIIFHTDPGEKGKTVSGLWIGSLDKGTISEFTDDDKSAILLPLTNAFNIRTGALALYFPKSHIEIPVNNMFSYLLEYFVISLGIFTIITFAAVSLFSRNIVRNFNGMRTFLEDSLGGKPVDLAEKKTAGLQEEVITFRDRSMEVLRKIEDASIELRQIEAEESQSAG